MRVVTEFSEVSKYDTGLVGKRGAMLADISNSKMQVPQSFIITTEAYDFFLESNNIKKDVSELLEAENHGKVVELIENSVMPDQIVSKVSKAYNNLSLNREIIIAGKKDITVAIYASLTIDMDLQASIESACGSNEVLYAIQNCWSQLYSENNIAKLKEKGIDPRSVKLAVVVQSILRGEKSGRIKTQDSDIEIEANWGVMPPSDIISVPDYYLLGKENLDIKEKRIGNQKKMYKLVQNKVSEVSVPLGMNDQQKLSETELKQAAKQLLKAEKQLQVPVALEWVKYANEVIITNVSQLKTEQPSPGESVQTPAMDKPAEDVAEQVSADVPSMENAPSAVETIGSAVEDTKENAPSAVETIGSAIENMEKAPEPAKEEAEAVESIELVPTADEEKSKTAELPEVQKPKEELFTITGTRILSHLKAGDMQGDIRIDSDGVGILDLSDMQNQQDLYSSIKHLLEMFYPKEVWVLLSKNRDRQKNELENIRGLRNEGYTNAMPLFSGIVDASQLPESSIPFGILADTPASLILIEEISRKAAFVNIDVPEITGLVLNRIGSFDESANAVTELISSALAACKRNKTPTGALVQSQLILPFLIRSGISSVTSAQENMDPIRAEALSEEKRIILDRERT